MRIIKWLGIVFALPLLIVVASLLLPAAIAPTKTPTDRSISVSGKVKGNSNAPLTLTVYSDFQ